MSRENPEAPMLDQFALDHIAGYAKRRGIPLRQEHFDFLLRTMPYGAKGSVVALGQAVHGLCVQEFTEISYDQDLTNITPEDFSLALVRSLSRMHTYEDRTVFEFGVAEWLYGWHARLSKRQIEMWEKDRNPHTQMFSEWHAKGARACIKQGAITLDEQHASGVYALYKLDRGLSSLLSPGVGIYTTEKGRYSEEQSRQSAEIIYPFLCAFVTI